VTHVPDQTSLTGLALNEEQPRDKPFHGQQRLPGNATQATLTVSAEWNSGSTDGPRTGGVEFEGTCEQQERPAVDWQFTCDGITVDATNPSGSPHSIFIEIVGDDHFRIDVEPGATVTHPIEAGEGTTVQVTHGEETLAMIAWEEPDGCEESTEESTEEPTEEPTEEEGNGTAGGDELAATGSPTAWIAGAAVALLLVGGGLYALARRRGVTFTS
jgi:LPXTG-motif cell wall-anchored protein